MNPTDGEKTGAWWLAPEFRSINFRRAAQASTWVRDHPGKTAWELHEISGMVYAELSKGLQKGREHGLFRCEPEDRGAAGGVRYRYWLSDTATDVLAVWAERGHLTEPA